METLFTPVEALVGGALIGAAVFVLFHTLGRIAGVSGMLGAALRAATPTGERLWRMAFLLGLLIGPLAAIAILDRPLVQPSPASCPDASCSTQPTRGLGSDRPIEPWASAMARSNKSWSPGLSGIRESFDARRSCS